MAQPSAGSGVKAQPTHEPLTPKKTPAFQITSLDTEARYLKALFYGEFGIGKTVLSGSAFAVDAMRDILVISAEGGNLSLIGDKIPDMDTIRIQNFTQLARVTEYLKAHCELRPKAEQGDKDAINKLRQMEAFLKGVDIEDIEKPRLYRTAILDSVSEVESMHLYSILGIDDNTKLDDELPGSGWDEYRENLNKMQLAVRRFRDLPMHVLVTCAATFKENERKQRLWRPALTGQLSGSVQGFMDLVGFYQFVEVTEDDKRRMIRRLWVQPVGTFNAKCRFSRYKLPYIDSPTMSTIMDAIGLA